MRPEIKMALEVTTPTGTSSVQARFGCATNGVSKVKTESNRFPQPFISTRLRVLYCDERSLYLRGELVMVDENRRLHSEPLS